MVKKEALCVFMKIKVIDLLNMISKGEKVPRKIEYDGIIYTRGWSDYMGDEPITEYYNHDIHGSWFNGNELTLDKEIEIIEEDKEIEKIKTHQEYTSKGKLHDYLYYQDNKYAVSLPQKVLTDKLNELIDAVNELKKGK